MLIYALRFLSLALQIAVSSSHLIVPGFEFPSNEHRARFRYWLPDASVDINRVTADAKLMKEVGAGGIQLNNFYNFGLGNPSLPPMNTWDEYGFGSHKYKEIFEAILDTCEAVDLRFEFAIGANQGQGVPSKPLTPGLAVHLVYGEKTVRRGEVFDGKLPEANVNFNFHQSTIAALMNPLEDFGPSELLGVVAGGIKSASAPSEKNHSEVILDESTLVDLSTEAINGSLVWTAPSEYPEYALFAIYKRYTNQRSCGSSANAQSIIGNGSWVTDHFSAQGAKLVTEFWENEILNNNIKNQLAAVGEHSWEDSMEFLSGVYWSADLLERWRSSKGYDPMRYLPLLFHQSNSYRAEFPPYNKTFVLEEPNQTQNRYLQDYRAMLGEGYTEYLQAFGNWTQSFGLSHSAEVSYHLPLDMSSHIPVVGRPELESLAFPDFDHMYQFTGSAHLSGKNVVSSELGAALTGAYTVTLPELIGLFNDEFAAGVNMMVLHGMPYTGEYGESTWPGYTPLAYLSAELWSPRVPSWNYLNESMTYAARNQVVLQTGVPKRDVAFYLFASPWHATIAYESNDLVTAGYSYEYLGIHNLESQAAITAEGILVPKGPGYRALILDNQPYISLEAAQKLVVFAKDGLPIFIKGQLPRSVIGSSGQEKLSQVMEALQSYPNVEFVTESENLADRLASTGIKPRVSIRPRSDSMDSRGRDLRSLWRSSDNMDLVFLYNNGSSESFVLTFEVGVEKVPYRLNAWTGEQAPLMVYNRSGSSLSLTISLAQGQTYIAAFVPSCEETDRTYILSHSENVEIIEVSQTVRGDEIVALIDDSDAATLRLSNDTVLEIPATATLLDSSNKSSHKLPVIVLSHWNLTIESWVPPSNTSNTTRSAIDVILLGLQPQLQPWTELDGMASVSGVGIYTASFVLPPDWDFDGMALRVHFGRVLDGLRAWVNGQSLQSLDNAAPEADITEFLMAGENYMRVETSSTLFNAVKARVGQLESVGMTPIREGAYTEVEYRPFGLVGPVSLRALRRVVVG